MQYFLIIFEIRAYKPGWEKKKKRKKLYSYFGKKKNVEETNQKRKLKEI